MSLHFHKSTITLIALALLTGALLTSCNKETDDTETETGSGQRSGGGGGSDDPTPFDPTGTVGADALFSVSPTQQVKFATSNLMFHWQIANGDTSYVWHFADNAWDVCGKGNEAISRTCTTDIDLFGWGTGTMSWPPAQNNPTATNTKDSIYAHFTAGGDLIIGSQDDWGNCVTDPAGGRWRTLSQSEWHYLLRERECYRFAKAMVNDVNGLIIFPDEWTVPDGVKTPTKYNDTAAYYNANYYTKDDWVRLAANGATFLPCTGYRVGGNVRLVNDYGAYWSSSLMHYADSIGFGAFATCFYQPQGDYNRGNVRTDIVNSLHEGHAVRLVKNQ